jgi:hypothetical protein
MVRKQRGRVGTTTETSSAGASPLDTEKTVGPCAVCGMNDARALVAVDLTGGERATLCGSHDLMHRRAGSPATSVAALRTLFANRRGTERRGTNGDVDELAEALSAAFCRDRRSSARRAS